MSTAAEKAKAWIVTKGQIPAHAQATIPSLAQDCGNYHWNIRSDAKYRGPTCRPTYDFSWTHRGDGSIEVKVVAHTPSGDMKETQVFS